MESTIRNTLGAIVLASVVGLAGCGEQPVREVTHKLRVPYNEGGLPLPFAKYIVGYNKEWPAKVEFHSIGPMFYNAQVRAPTEEEGNWYVSRLKKLKE
jgi:hypothetical protein